MSAHTTSAVERVVGVTVNVDNSGFGVVTVQPPEQTARTPVDLVCVIDVSGSMGINASYKAAAGEVESTGLTILDVVKHAVNTIVHTLGNQDRIALVPFSSSADVVMPLTRMNTVGQERAMALLQKMDSGGGTNLTDGILRGLDVLKTQPQTTGERRTSAVVILTDGQPDSDPKPALEEYRIKNGLNCTINSFGFGYNLDSKLLYDFATIGNGIYAFIPDCSFVGTVFVHTLANILTQISTPAKLTLEPLGGATINLCGGLPSVQTPHGVSVDIGALQGAQPKHICFNLGSVPSTAPCLRATLSYRDAGSPPTYPETKVSLESAAAVEPIPEIEAQRCRTLFIDTVSQILQRRTYSPSSIGEVQHLVDTLTHSPAISEECVAALLQDASGQVTEAVSRADWFAKWGVHYLPSLMRAHIFEQCNNFKDPGVQLYGSALFSSIRDTADDIFCKLPAPVPHDPFDYAAYGMPPPTVASVNMASFNSSYNPCFAGKCHVAMSNNETKRVSEIKAGDIVLGGARVECVVQTTCANAKEWLVQFADGLLVTPWHPIRMGEKWMFPCEMGKPTLQHCESVYSFILNEKHILTIDGVECVTLGHNFKGEKVEHPYWGTKRVIEDLRMQDGWTDGRVVLQPNCVLRDPITVLSAHTGTITIGGPRVAGGQTAMALLPPPRFSFAFPTHVSEETLLAFLARSLSSSPSRTLRRMCRDAPHAAAVLASVMSYTATGYANEIRLVRGQAYVVVGSAAVDGVTPDKFFFSEHEPRDTFEPGEWVNIHLAVGEADTDGADGAESYGCCSGTGANSCSASRGKWAKFFPRVFALGQFYMASLRPAHIVVTAWLCATAARILVKDSSTSNCGGIAHQAECLLAPLLCEDTWTQARIDCAFACNLLSIAAQTFEGSVTATGGDLSTVLAALHEADNMCPLRQSLVVVIAMGFRRLLLVLILTITLYSGSIICCILCMLPDSEWYRLTLSAFTEYETWNSVSKTDDALLELYRIVYSLLGAGCGFSFLTVLFAVILAFSVCVRSKHSKAFKGCAVAFAAVACILSLLGSLYFIRRPWYYNQTTACVISIGPCTSFRGSESGFSWGPEKAWIGSVVGAALTIPAFFVVLVSSSSPKRKRGYTQL
ncbi:von willebrand factor type A domain protein [Pelomyxa schiedti]|nr:von willebrand factor type A domain protein [Pelomyxa schiedti]